MKKLIHKEDLIKVIGKDNVFTRGLASVAMSVLGVNKINRMYSPSAHLNDSQFTQHMLNVYGVTYDSNDAELSAIPKEGPFMVVGNHPFGAIEGIILFDAIAKVRPDFKMMANFILSNIPNLKNVFIPVNPFTNNPEWGSSVGGIKAAMEHLSNGNGLGVFPAGEVSRYNGNDYPEDIEWSVTISKLAKKAKVPVVPIYFDGKNSNKFYRLDKINSMFGTAMLLNELYNKRGQHITMKIGKPILPSEIDAYDDPKRLAAYMRARSYALEANVNNHESQVSTTKQESLSPPLKSNLLINELRKIREKSHLFTCAQYECYFADYDDIPNIMYEMGRRREEAFRAIGEGSGKKLDTDKYDTYYKHLVLWDKDENRLVGGYRLGIGSEIVEQKGINGFYISSLFKLKEPFKDVLKKSIELGRSFVTVDYQKDILPLMLLLKGLMMVAYKMKDVEYFIGPVSISNWYPTFYKSMMVEYISREFSCDELKDLVEARTPFVVDFLKVDADVLLENNIASIEKFDRYMMKLSNGDYRLPTLFKKYLKMQSKFLCFNIDPDFHDALDGLLLQKFEDIPESELLMLMKDSSDEEKELMVKRFLNK
ncbi:MAG: lysophospholipid acyltransferase family protein [Bacteroidales bacterium]|nr:lysophospholipid acyltransferase family protein [Bacteroidales bacterium]